MTTAPKWILSLAVATAVSLGSLASANAELTGDRAPTRTVRVWDLDLKKPEDVQTLYERVQAAANAACQDEARQNYRATRHRAPAGWTKRCVSDAVDSVVRDVPNPLLAALHVRTGVARNN
jgi:UrcA family protein